MPPERVLLTGWGRTSPTAARLVTPRDADGVAEVVAAAPGRGVVARGLGRSYGDAAQNAGGDVVDMTALSAVRAFDGDKGVVTVDAGASLDQLLHLLVPSGWFLPVTPGTRFVTVGGAVAADVHGKNHHRDGTFGDAVVSLRLQTPGGAVEVSPQHDAEAFWATIGGMGLTGVVREVTLRLKPVETSWMRVIKERGRDLDDVMARMVERDRDATYSVAWVDAYGLGRGVVSSGEHARLDDLDGRRAAAARAYRPHVRVTTPAVPLRVVTAPAVRVANAGWYRAAPVAPRQVLTPLAGYFYPLDAVAGWNRVYGRHGFLQYQFVVPDDGADVVAGALQRLVAAGAVPALAVLKRFGPANQAPLSFPIAGWTLAVDLPADPALAAVLDGLDERVAAAGGRVYLAKDARMRPDLVAAMYPRLDDWRTVCERLDPDGRVQSDLSRRLGLRR